MIHNKNSILCLLTILLVFTSFANASGNRSADSGNRSQPVSVILPEEPINAEPFVEVTPVHSEEIIYQEEVFVPPDPSRAELIMKAFAAAYPDRIGQAELRDGDWAVRVYGEWFYYAEGRLLPDHLRDKSSSYSAQPVYFYPAELPPWTEPSEDESQRYRNMANNRNTNILSRAPFFHDALFRAGNRSDAYDRIKSIRFLGKQLMVHYSILGPLSLVEDQILKEAKRNAAVQRWINELETAEGWVWRDIVDNSNRSFHSYGTAIDLVPNHVRLDGPNTRSSRGLELYWLWTSTRTPEWWKVPYERRYHPPAEVIRAFESYGFIWGGKWEVYDTVHFEYRPEILIYNNVPMAEYR